MGESSTPIGERAANDLPCIIQGGMGAGVSNWRLANAVASQGQLGVVSGTALDVILARRLQVGDPDGAMRRALAAFPCQATAQRVLEKYFVPGGKAPDAPFKATPMPAIEPSRHQLDLLLVSNFAEVWLAKEGHDGVVGINYLEKIQTPNVPSLLGAMLADVDYVLMGAGIPKAIPGVLDNFAAGEPAELTVPVVDNPAGANVRLDPREALEVPLPKLRRPAFLAIVASASLANMLQKKSNGRVDGFVVEGPTAGGHNAPPRGRLQLDATGQPIYGERDVVDPADFVALGVPFWLAGSYGTPEGLRAALAVGATGVQAGTAFAFCEESGIAPELKRGVLDMVLRGEARVITDPLASPTGFPFKVVDMPGTLKEPKVYAERQRICDLGYLRHAYQDAQERTRWRCPSEPIDDYVKKGGELVETEGRMCVCNGLMATIGLAQTRKDGRIEPPVLTSGDAVSRIDRFLPPGAKSYSARDVLDAFLEDLHQTDDADPSECAVR